jgi:hypothetical protein
MIKTNTVLVLGAGASMPYKLPSGASLRDSICASVLNDGSALSRFLSTQCGIGENQRTTFGRAFLGSRLLSIDTFLSRRSEFEEVGKLCIAFELCRQERADELTRIGSDDDWYSYLWGILTLDAPDADHLANNQLRILTFNYDRSLECMLHEATKHTFGLDDAAALKAWQRIGIRHVYGQLGEFGVHLTNSTRPYNGDPGVTSVKVAASAIRIVPEARTNDDIFLLVRNWFSDAGQIIFLGFGFDPLNVERLGLADVVSSLAQQRRPVPTVFATVVGKTPAEIRQINEALCSKFNNFAADGNENLMALRTWNNLR